MRSVRRLLITIGSLIAQFAAGSVAPACDETVWRDARVENLVGEKVYYCGSNNEYHYLSVVSGENFTKWRISNHILALDRAISVPNDIYVSDNRYFFPVLIEDGRFTASTRIVQHGESILGQPIVSIRSVQREGLASSEYLQPRIVFFDGGYIRYVEELPGGHLFSYARLDESEFERFGSLLLSVLRTPLDESYEVSDSPLRSTSEICVVYKGVEHRVIEIIGYKLDLRKVNPQDPRNAADLPPDLVKFCSFLETLPVETMGVSVTTYSGSDEVEFSTRSTTNDEYEEARKRDLFNRRNEDIEVIGERVRGALERKRSSANLSREPSQLCRESRRKS